MLLNKVIYFFAQFSQTMFTHFTFISVLQLGLEVMGQVVKPEDVAPNALGLNALGLEVMGLKIWDLGAEVLELVDGYPILG